MLLLLLVMCHQDHFVICGISIGWPEGGRDPRVEPLAGCSRLPVDETTRPLVESAVTVQQGWNGEQIANDNNTAMGRE